MAIMLRLTVIDEIPEKADITEMDEVDITA